MKIAVVESQVSKGSPVTSRNLNLSMTRDRMIALIFPLSFIRNQARVRGGTVRAVRTSVHLDTLMDARVVTMSKEGKMT